MRVVPNASLSRVGEGAPEGLFPSAERLASVRRLAVRFPAAGLREVALVKVSPRVAPGAAALGSRSRVWLALESMQTTGSFKVRGALVAISALASDREIVAVSAGNHGIGVAHAAKVLGRKATVVVPSGAPRAKTDKIAACGAVVIRASSPGYDDAEREAIALAEARGAVFLSPYDDVDVIAGNGASLGFEIIDALGKVPDRVIAPIGGGGLATGLACAFGGERPRVWGIQSEASCAFARSLERGSAVTTLPYAETLAEGLEGGLPERAFARVRATLAGCLVATEEELAAAMTFAFRELGLALEGSAAIALAPLLVPPALLRQEEEEKEEDVVLVLTGRNVDPERLARVVC
ncbi:MAG: pyridoxal-phosphate dependent enzyme [Labilithrix sp.]|nr:pyridoxal-phosphate dependent enzyme [Labilithrix sp.]